MTSLCLWNILSVNLPRKTEGKLLDNLTLKNGLYGLKKFKDMVDLSYQVSEAHYPLSLPEANNNILNTWFDNDGHKDAFRHAYASALLTKMFGQEWTSQLTTAHEAEYGNYAVKEAMDLYNNKVGISMSIKNPTASKEDLAHIVDRSIKNG